MGGNIVAGGDQAAVFTQCSKQIGNMFFDLINSTVRYDEAVIYTAVYHQLVAVLLRKLFKAVVGTYLKGIDAINAILYKQRQNVHHIAICVEEHLEPALVGTVNQLLDGRKSKTTQHSRREHFALCGANSGKKLIEWKVSITSTP